MQFTFLVKLNVLDTLYQRSPKSMDPRQISYIDDWCLLQKNEILSAYPSLSPSEGDRSSVLSSDFYMIID